MTTKFSYSQAILAMAIAYFAYALMSFSAQIPGFIHAVDRATPHIASIVNEVDLVRTEVAQVRDVVDKQLPAILSRIDSSLPLVEQGLTQSESYAQQLPNLWRHLDKMATQLSQIQQELPSLLKRVDAIVLMTNRTTDELAKWRPHSTKYLAELQQSRTDIPQYLTRIEYIITDAKTLGKEASSGLVSGFFKGVISLPFEVVSGLTGMIASNSKSAKLLTTADMTLLQERTVTLLENSEQKSIVWHNAQSGNRGQIIKGAEFKQAGLSCHKISIINDFNGQKETLKELMCEDNKGLWQVM